MIDWKCCPIALHTDKNIPGPAFSGWRRHGHRLNIKAQVLGPVNEGHNAVPPGYLMRWCFHSGDHGILYEQPGCLYLCGNIQR